jgi:hypothetical protein
MKCYTKAIKSLVLKEIDNFTEVLNKEINKVKKSI